ncbi:MAG: VOC family protein [Noviherbaspirillum sp.]
MAHIEPVLDHAIINVRENLDQATDTFRRLGFSLTPRGHHTLGSSNHLCIFGENYLELLGYESAAKRPELAQQPLGLAGLVFKAEDADGVFQALQARGVSATAPREFHRPVPTASGMEEAGFRTVNLEAGLVPNGRAFFCHHLTPHLVWQAEWQAHPNKVNQIAGFAIATEEPARASALYADMFGAASVTEERDGTRILAAGQAKVQFMTPGVAQARFGPGASPAADGTDRMVALVLRTESLQAASQALARGGVEALTDGAALLVHAGQAWGCALRFVEEGHL